jgi:hypothetical protein
MNRRSLALLSLTGVLLAGSCLHAQDAAGRIIGTVTDPTAAAIPNAKITVVNAATQVKREAVTDREGNYQILAVPIGKYNVTAESSGFAKTTISAAELNINQSLHLDFKLEVSSAAETVQVEAQASNVETVNATLGQSVTSRPIVNLPLNGRNMFDLALLQPGVTPGNGNNSAAPFSIAGSRGDSITFLLDGGVNNNLLNNAPVLNPNPDTVAEFRILTSNYNAEYGRNAGGIVSVVTKSGTNALHGSAFEFLRNEKMNANSFFNNLNDTPRSILKRNQFGFTVGGPIVIPKVLNGKDKLFFFSSYQGQRLAAQTSNGSVTTFTPAELNGDFSRSNSGRTGPDDNVVAFLQANPYFQPDPTKAMQGIIDPSRIAGVASNYIKAGLIPTSPTGQLFPTGSAPNNFDETTNKIDWNITLNDRITATLGWNSNNRVDPFRFATVNGYPNNFELKRYFGSINYTKIFSAATLNEFRFTAQRNNNLQSVPGVKLPTASELGVGVTPDNPTGPPNLSFASGLDIGFSVQGPTALIDNTYTWADTFSWTRGRHSLKFGGNITPYQNNTVYDFYVNGNFFFSGDPGNGGIGSGNDYADFLLGYPDEYLQFGQAPSNIRSKNYGGFAQDEWRVRNNLVLTMGLRYEYSSPKKDLQGRSFSLNPGAKSTRFVNAPIGLQFPGDPGAPDGSNFPDKNDFAPRFGFAYAPNSKTSIRGGFGMFYDILKGEDNLQFNGQAPFFGFADLFFDPSTFSGASPIYTDPFGTAGIPNSFPSRPPQKDIDFDGSGFLPFGGGGVYFVDRNLRTPYVFQYNLSVQRQLAGSMIAEVSYVGNSSHKLTALTDSNPFVLGTTNRVLNTTPGNDRFSFSYVDTFRNLANSNYNSLQASLQRRMSDNRYLGGSYFQLSYTYGKAIDNASGFRERGGYVPAYNRRQFYAVSDNDVTNRIAFSGGWDIPFERWTGWDSRVTKGWSLYPIYTYRTGFPLDVFAGISRSRTRTGPSAAGDPNQVRANLVGSRVTVYDPKAPLDFGGLTGNYYFSPANFSTDEYFADGFDPVNNPAQRTYGTLGRNAFRGPTRSNLDLALAKTTSLFGERVKAEFRAEAFNLFNSAQFSSPSTSYTSSLFGQITNTADPRIMQLAMRFIF